MRKILVVDDELVSRKKMAKILTNYGRCSEVETGTLAIKMFEQALLKGEPFDLISLDVGLPDRSGTEILIEIREIEAEKPMLVKTPVKVLMVTAHSDRDTVLTSIQAGCDQYVVKPFTPDLVYKKLKEMGLHL